jgi:hypothetical protein
MHDIERMIGDHITTQRLKMKSAFLFLLALYLVLMGISAYELIVLVHRLPFEASTVYDIVVRPLESLIVAGAIVIPWRLLESRRGKLTPAPILIALLVVGYLQYSAHVELRASIGL